MSDTASTSPDQATLLDLTADVVTAYVGKNAVAADSLPDLIRTVFTALQNLANPPEDRPQERLRPAVPISRSVTDEYIVCLEDGAKLKMLKRYLRTNFEMTPEEYRKRWNLPADYPMVAPSYAKRRSEFAKEIGLGRGVRRTRGPKIRVPKPAK